VTSKKKQFFANHAMCLGRNVLLVAAWLGASCNAASAQNAPSGIAAASTDQDALVEIVVTANKREQNLNDVGLSVAAIDGQTLRNRNIETLADLANNIPGLSFTNSSTNTPVFTLRGVGFYDTSLADYPDVSVYIDEVPLPFPALTSHAAFDLDRVEVLKGPQGTLFGENSTGGAINYIVAKPTTTYQTGFDVGYGRFNTFTGEGFVSGPLTDVLLARFSTRIENGSGWQYSNTRKDESNGHTANYMARLLLDFAPSDRVKFSLNINGWLDKSATQAKQYIALGPQFAVEDPLVAAEHFSPQNPRASDWTPGFTNGDNSLWQVALRADIEVLSDITLTSLTNYVDYRQNSADDGDGLPESASDLRPNDGDIQTFTQELRLANHDRSGLRWVVGANFEHSIVDQFVFDYYPNSSANATLGEIGYPVTGNDYSSDQGMLNYAGFANAEYDISQFTLKAGARYTKADRSTVNCESDPSGRQNNIGGFFKNVQLGGAYGPIVPGECFAINNTAATINGVAPGAPGEYASELDESNLSWRVGLDWKPTSDLLTYANVAKGFKAGGFVAASASTFSQYQPVKQESVLSYEVGIKDSLFDKKLQLNGAVFYYDYDNKQIRAKLIDPVFGELDQLQNIPKSSVKGAEFEATTRPLRDLTLGANFTYLDAKVKEFTGINGAGVESNFAGAQVPFTPKYQFGINADYSFPVVRDWRGFVGASENFRSDTVTVIGGNVNPANTVSETNCVYCISSYGLLDLRTGVQRDSLRIELWGKNVLNKYYWNNVVENFDAIARQAGMPATFGITVSDRF
jgi:iron complex outermembrane recepter protein